MRKNILHIVKYGTKRVSISANYTSKLIRSLQGRVFPYKYITLRLKNSRSFTRELIRHV